MSHFKAEHFKPDHIRGESREEKKEKEKLAYELNSVKIFLFFKVILQNGDTVCVTSRKLFLSFGAFFDRLSKSSSHPKSNVGKC